MMLTDKCKKMFEEWYKVKYRYALRTETRDYINDMDFDMLPFSMQQGVYLEFLREQGYEITNEITYSRKDKHSLYSLSIHAIDKSGWMEDIDWGHEYNLDYNTALTQATTKCNELINGSVK